MVNIKDNDGDEQFTIEVQPFLGLLPGESWLSIEGAETACSVALQSGNECHVAYYPQPRGHAEVLLSMVDAVLAQASVAPAQLRGIVVSRGPGAFTGLRISMALAQALAYAWSLPVCLAPSLEALAFAAGVLVPESVRCAGHFSVLAAHDARMDEIYVAGFRCLYPVTHGASLQMSPWLEEQVIAPSLLSDKLMNQSDNSYSASVCIGVGSGMTYESILAQQIQQPLMVRLVRLTAVHLLQWLFYKQSLGDVALVEAEEVVPVYLRGRVAEPNTG